MKKILVINLLRIGDVVLTTPALKGLREKFPHAEIHYLMNENFQHLTPILPFVKKVHYFPRKTLQEMIGNADAPLSQPIKMSQKFVKKLSAENYDLVINTTQNKLSGYLTRLIQARDKIGLSLNHFGHPSYGNSWYRYLNDYVAFGGKNVFHMSDIYNFGCGIKAPNSIFLQETKSGREEAKFFAEPKDKGIIAFQPFTSDPKKELPGEKAIQLVVKINEQLPNFRVVLVAAPNEKERGEEIINGINESGGRCELAVLSLEGLLSFLTLSECLLTMDTSVKHIACATDCKIIEICLGSSDFKKTGVYKTGQLLVHSSAECYPCPHSRPCSRAQHECSAFLSTDVLALIVKHYVEGDYPGLKVLHREFSKSMRIYRSSLSKLGFWIPIEIGADFGSGELNVLLEKFVMKMFLQLQHLKPVGEYGSEGLKLKHTVQSMFPSLAHEKWSEAVDHLVTRNKEVESILSKMDVSFKRAVKKFNDMEFVPAFEEMHSLIEQVDEVPPSAQHLFHRTREFSEKRKFSELRKVQVMVSELKAKTQIKNKILNVLKDRQGEM